MHEWNHAHAMRVYKIYAEKKCYVNPKICNVKILYRLET